MSTTKRTLSEIRAMCTKAVRGAGCPWGMAEEAGVAASLLEAHDLPGAAAIADLLVTQPKCLCAAGRSHPNCGLSDMVALADCPLEEEQVIAPLAAPVLLLAPLLLCAQDQQAWHVTWDGGEIWCGASGIASSGAPLHKGVQQLKITPSTPPVSPRPRDWRARSVPDEAWQILEDFAARTYVPESAASRASGAGPEN